MNKLLLGCLACLISTAAVAQIPVDAKFNGQCAMTMANEGKSVPTDCKISWKAPNNVGTYCFASNDALSAWSKDPMGNLQKAEMMNAKNLQNDAMNKANQAMNDSKAMMDQAMKAMEQSKGMQPPK